MTKPDKTRRKNSSGAKKLRDQKVIAERMAGKTTQEIADEVGLTRQSVSKILNSDETKAIITAAASDMCQMVIIAVQRVADAIQDKYNPAGERCALAVLKSAGVLKESVDLNHQFPKPLVIKRLNGDTITLTTKEDGDEDSN